MCANRWQLKLDIANLNFEVTPKFELSVFLYTLSSIPQVRTDFQCDCFKNIDEVSMNHSGSVLSTGSHLDAIIYQTKYRRFLITGLALTQF